MKRTLTDLSQLSKEMFNAGPKVDEVKPAPPKAKPHDDGEDVLAYFSRPAVNAMVAQKATVCAPPTDGAESQTQTLERDVAALRAQLRDSEAARSNAETKASDLDRERAKLAGALASAHKEVERLKGECGRLQGEMRRRTVSSEGSPGEAEPKETARCRARKAALAAMGAADAKAEPSAARYEGCIIVSPAAIAETFPGEVREMVLSALSEARDTAHQSTRERRATILDAVLAANRPTGELERRRSELKQTMKDCGYYTDPKALERLGFKLISGRTHWKLEYGNVRMPIAKTPSDYRANLNMATDLANHCF